MSDEIKTQDPAQSILFDIEKLSCAYGNNSPVLVAENIQIPRRKITVLLGPSGAGKSTLLETLGLMTRTVNGTTSSIKFHPSPDKEYNLAEMWDDDKEAGRYHVRMLYYSFIFQSTNLMPNFTALENVGLTELIQNKPESEAYFNAIESLVKNLSVTSLSYGKKPFQFSGGERQRLAFARATNPEFTVLFGDEPTGNLDHFNSVKLMHFIRDFITRQRENVSAIIVSHNIPLTLDFADRIIVMSKRADGVSTIDPHFVFDRDQLKWYESYDYQLRIQKEIELLLNSDTESYVRILLHLSENKVDGQFFKDVKDSMTEYILKLEHEKDLPEAEKIEYQNWLKSKLQEKEIYTPAMEEYIKQFAFGEVKKADIKINDVIRTIQDLKFKTAVEGQRDRRTGGDEGDENGFEMQEFGHSETSMINALLGFFPWLILSIAPLASSIFAKFVDVFANLWSSIGKKWKKQKADDADDNSMFEFSLRDIIPSTFYKLCIAWDWINVKYKLIAKYRFKLSSIQYTPIPHDFKHLFYRNETKELLGKGNKNFWLIVVILAFTFLAIGFSSGSLKYLKYKMEDPFVRSISASIPNSNANINTIMKLYNADSLQNMYNYDTIVGYNRWTSYFQGDQEDSPNRNVDGRSIPFDDPLVKTIVNPEINNAIGNVFHDANDYSVIVTRSMLQKLGCSKDPAFIYKTLRDGRKIPVPIRAVVDKLPGDRVEFITTQHFYNNHIGLGDGFLFKDNKQLYAYIVIDSSKVEAFQEACTNFFDRYAEEGGVLELNNVDVYKHSYCYRPLYYLQVSFFNSDDIPIEEIDALYQEFRNSDEIQSFMEAEGIASNDFVQSYFDNQDQLMSRRFDFLSINFNDLSKVDAFTERFAEEAGIKIEMSKIEQMKNYNFVSKLTRIMSIILIGFSVVMINIFLSNILSTHLNNIKMNIGTFKAFGIDIKRIYIGMMYIFVLLPLILALIIAGAMGYLGFVYFLIDIMSPFAVEKNLYFDLFNGYTLVSIVVLAIVNYYAFSVIIDKIFRQTPGDLIYDRNNKA